MNGNWGSGQNNFGNQHWRAQYQDAKSEKETFWQLKNHSGSPKQSPLREKTKERYPIYSDVQELQDELQSIYASGTAFTEQKTIDVTESEYRMLPFKVFRIVFKGIVYSTISYIIPFFLFVAALVAGVGIGGFYPPSLLIAYCSLFFYAYVVYGMKQFVIPDEKQPKTKQFYAQVIAGWRFVEFYIVFATTILLVAEITFESWQGVLEAPLRSLYQFSSYIRITPDMVETALFHTVCIAIILLVTYFLFVRWAYKKFAREQHKNVIAIKAQYNRADAAVKALDGEI